MILFQLKPLAPNLLLLNILSFDVDIESLLNGNVQLLLTTVPVTGNFLANTRQLSITALFDLQKDQNRVSRSNDPITDFPFAHFSASFRSLTCEWPVVN
jgi:hypothetical protein